MIEDHPVFLTTSHNLQNPLSVQLVIGLFWFGHNGIAATIEAIAQWAGVSASIVVNCTCRVIVSFLALHDFVVHWPSKDEKKEVKSWVESVSCPEWRNGYCVVNGTPIDLCQKPR
jgi:hypothetical protein